MRTFGHLRPVGVTTQIARKQTFEGMITCNTVFSGLSM
jgi:hypothetical protein